VNAGLAEGDLIITEGIQSLREGTAINIASPDAAKAPNETAKK
jgi:hypothetical protein